jgi:hypothetical protein
MTTENLKLTARQQAAIERLIDIAHSDTGQSRKVANFLLAWWNAEQCGGFDLTDLWNVDRSIAEDMLTVFGLLIHCTNYPDHLGYGSDFAALIRAWRPALVAPH